MNKNIFIVAIVSVVVLLVYSIYLYNQTKSSFIEEKVKYKDFATKVEKINAIKNYYEYKILPLKKYCKIVDDNVYKVECNKLDKKKFQKVQNLLFNPHIKILKYKLELKNGFVFIKGELSK